MKKKSPVNKHLPLRFMICHLNPASARLRFLKSTEGYVCQPESLPSLSDLLEDYGQKQELATHPAMYLQTVSERLGINFDRLQLESGFRCWVDTPAQVLPVFLVRVNSESPFTAPEGYQWIELPDSFRLTEVERQIMRHCYQWLME